MAKMKTAKPARRENPETTVLREITERLESIGYPLAKKGTPGAVVRMAVGPVLKKGGRGANPLKGFPDLMVFLKNGRLATIEVKRKGGGMVEPDQRAWMEYLVGRGVICIVARSADYAEHWIKKAEEAAEVRV